MPLYLKFDNQRIAVSRDVFTVGRHSECDLSVADGRLSREHLKIERFGGVFAATDLGSSNGTLINTTKLTKPTTLRNGDVLSLGGFRIEVELSANHAANGGSFSGFDEDFTENETAAENADLPLNPPKSNVVSSAPKSNSTAKSLLILAPVLALVIVVSIVGAVILFGRSGEKEIVKKDDDFIYTHDKNTDLGDDGDNSNPAKTATPKPTATSEKTTNSANTTTDTTPAPDNSNAAPTPKNLPDTAKVEQNSASFLRKISQNDPKAFLTSEQAQIVNQKIKQFANSPDLADNIKSARSNAAQIQSVAAAKNLKPQFVAVAALAKLGASRGNVSQTAQGMADVLDKLSIQLGNELADDSILTVAVYDQGAAGDFLKTRNLLQDLSNKYPESSRTIRTIWFLHKNGKISDAEYDFALRFLAIGTITQNPKDFSVNAEELKLN